MADTHPNAYRAEIHEKRQAASNLNAEADALQSQLDLIEPPEETPETEESEPVEVAEAPEKTSEEASPVKVQVKTDSEEAK